MVSIPEDIVDRLLKANNRIEKLSEEQIEKIRKFDVFIRARRQITEITRSHQITTIIAIAVQLNKPFEDVAKEDMIQFIGGLQKRYSPATMEQKKVMIKKFWRWLEKPEVIDWIKLQPNFYQKEIDPKSLWTDSEVKKLINAFSHKQHQALVAVLHESEARISELLSMNICDVTEQGDNFNIYLRNSKSKKRTVGLCHSVIYLKKWLEKHPYRNTPNHPLWISYSDRSKGERLKAVSVNEMLHNAQKRSGVNKKITPHLLRHSMCSKLRRQNYADAPHRIRMGLRAGSPIIERYTHISDEDANNEYLKTQGVKVPEEELELNLFEPIKCWKCGTVNTPTNKYCANCNSNITVESAERDFDITEVFRSKFIELYKLDVERVIKEYKHFKFDISNMQKILDCYNGGHVVTNDVIKKALRLDDDDCLGLLQYLMTAELIVLKEDKVILVDKTKYQQFIMMQKRYLEAK